jgi:cytochrome c oxidase subunit 3
MSETTAALHHADHAPHPRLVHHFEDLHGQKAASSLGMWLFLAQEVLFFGGLFAAYAVYRWRFYEAFAAGAHHLNVPLGAANTVVLIVSSLTMALAVHAAALGKGKQAATWLLLTVVLGTAFLGVKVVEYSEKIEHHLVPGPAFSAASLHLEGELAKQAEIYFSLYFAMTGLHALHMIIGIPILLGLAWRAWRGDYSPAWHTPVEMTGLYWHFVDIVWIFLFPFLYLIH